MAKLLVVAILAICSIGLCHAEWQLVWEDQFDGGNLADRWNFETGCHGWGNDELQCYTNNRWENARQENGILTIHARKENWENRQFTSSRMTTKANWLHGKFEMRARLPKGKHLWPAFWMMPANSEYGGWPRSGEMDIMEYRGQRPDKCLGTLHFGAAWNDKGDAGTGERTFPYEFSNDFHVFGFDWNSQRVQWLVDDQVYHEETLQRNFWEGVYNQWGQPFDKNFYMIINLAVGGNFFGGEPFDPIEADNWPKPTFEIDWIRKWEWR